DLSALRGNRLRRHAVQRRPLPLLPVRALRGEGRLRALLVRARVQRLASRLQQLVPGPDRLHLVRPLHRRGARAQPRLPVARCKRAPAPAAAAITSPTARTAAASDAASLSSPTETAVAD